MDYLVCISLDKGTQNILTLLSENVLNSRIRPRALLTAVFGCLLFSEPLKEVHLAHLSPFTYQTRGLTFMVSLSNHKMVVL